MNRQHFPCSAPKVLHARHHHRGLAPADEPIIHNAVQPVPAQLPFVLSFDFRLYYCLSFASAFTFAFAFLLPLIALLLASASPFGYPLALASTLILCISHSLFFASASFFFFLTFPAPHGRKGFVTGRIKESDISAIRNSNFVGSDVLRNTACFTGNHIGAAYIVE